VAHELAGKSCGSNKTEIKQGKCSPVAYLPNNVHPQCHLKKQKWGPNTSK